MRRTLVAMMAVGVGLVGATPALAVFPGKNGRIVYATGEGATYSVHTILPSGLGDTVIGHDGDLFSWSPNGRRIAFTGDPGPDIYTMRADGSHVRQLTFDGDNYGASFSPGGGRIVFTHGGTSASFVTTIRSDGSDRRVLVKSGAQTWAPNGQIAYLGACGLCVMRPNGTHRHRLVRLGNDGGYGPLYSPDGSKFLFVRYRLNDSAHTFVADGDGSNVRKPPCRNFLSSALLRPRQGPLPITYSPNGHRLLVKTPYQDSLGRESENLVRLSLRSCARSRVVSRTTGQAAWQPLP